MSFKKPLYTLCLLSLSVPAIGFGSPFWFFSKTPDVKPSASVAAPEAAAVPMTETEQNIVFGSSNDNKKSVATTDHHDHHGNWEVALSFGIGYRRDKLSQKATPHPLTSGYTIHQKYKEFNSVMGVFRIDARVSNFLFALEGDYSPTVSGQFEDNFKNNAAANSDAHFKIRKMTGYEADAMGTIGYRLKFLNGKKGKAYLIPQVGYRYSHQSYITEAQDIYTNPNQDGNLTQFLQGQSPNHTEWFGPYIEARLSFSFWDHLYVDPYYQYHFLDYRSRSKFALTNNNITLTGEFPTQDLIKLDQHNDSARGQSAGLDLYWQFNNRVRVGFKGSWIKFETCDAKGRNKTKSTNYGVNPTTSSTTNLKSDVHATWTSYDGYVYGGYAF